MYPCTYPLHPQALKPSQILSPVENLSRAGSEGGAGLRTGSPSITQEVCATSFPTPQTTGFFMGLCKGLCRIPTIVRPAKSLAHAIGSSPCLTILYAEICLGEKLSSRDLEEQLGQRKNGTKEFTIKVTVSKACLKESRPVTPSSVLQSPSFQFLPGCGFLGIAALQWPDWRNGVSARVPPPSHPCTATQLV